MKKPYQQIHETYSIYWKPVKLTGKCKTEVGGPAGQRPRKFYQIKGFFFKSWVPSAKIKFFEEETETIYDCTCIPNK
jgi:hypothetical protein